MVNNWNRASSSSTGEDLRSLGAVQMIILSRGCCRQINTLRLRRTSGFRGADISCQIQTQSTVNLALTTMAKPYLNGQGSTHIPCQHGWAR